MADNYSVHIISASTIVKVGKWVAKKLGSISSPASPASPTAEQTDNRPRPTPPALPATEGGAAETGPQQTNNGSEVMPKNFDYQNMFYIIISTFPKAYCHYLQTGLKTNPSAFGQLNEYGPFYMRKLVDFKGFCCICVALVLYMERLRARQEGGGCKAKV